MSNEKWDASNIPSQKGRVIIVTGATSGIGKETALVLAGKGASVIVAARNMQKGKKVVDEIQAASPESDVSVRELDLTSLASVKEFSSAVLENYDQLDVLINNAGIMMCPHSKTVDGFEIQMATNHWGHFALTGYLLPLLRKTKNSRVVVLSSLGHKMGQLDFSDLNWEKRKYNTNRAYADSKLANLYFAYHLARKFEQDENAPTVTMAHPGWTKTELQRHSGVISLLNNFFSQGIDMGTLPTLRAAIDEKAKSGDYFGPSKFFEMHGCPIKVKSNKLSQDMDAASQLWKQSEDITGVSY